MPSIKLPKLGDEFLKVFAGVEYGNGDALYKSGGPKLVLHCGCKIYSYFGKYIEKFTRIFQEFFKVTSNYCHLSYLIFLIEAHITTVFLSPKAKTQFFDWKCSCLKSVEFNSWCKHMVATLMFCNHKVLILV